MNPDTPLSVLFLWHQHQPLYKDGLTNRYEMPWVRLHATKDYYDMVALLDEYPKIKANFNLVPSLLTQLDDYAQGKAQDKFLELTVKRASELSFEDRQFILQNFFMAHWEHMVDPYPRYRELLEKRGRIIGPETISRTQNYFKEQDWRDLQMWFNLAWFDPLWREKDPRINGFFEKGKNFSEDDKQKLAAKQQEVCGQVVSKHKELQDRGQIEVTTTPFYHPILPLLCDTETARTALPHLPLPRYRFQHPEDAQEQLRRAFDDYSRRFGHAPQGLWPSEGSVSEESARLMVNTGLRWIATDEGVLANSVTDAIFRRDDLYEPYRFRVGDKHLNIFFRDHELSDAIGFVYASWDPKEAAKDFCRRLTDIHSRLKNGPHIVPVILDGENCWEYYSQDGLPFLRALYAELSTEPKLQTVRACDYLDQTHEIKTLAKLWSGSWINANFSIWIGHSEDNKAWDLLHRTRQFLVDYLSEHPDLKENSQTRQAWEEIYIAEGSDWCWWYGDDHSSSNDAAFDYLFRKHLMNVYTLLGEKVPDDLHLPIKKKRVKATILEPTDFIHPTLDGRVTNYFEWRTAGLYQTEAGGTGTMHKSENLTHAIYYGFDAEHLYLRIDMTRELTPEFLKGMGLKIVIHNPVPTEVVVHFQPEGKLQGKLRVLTPPGSEIELPFLGCYNKIIELGIALSQLSNPDHAEFEMNIVILKENLEQERWPSDAILKIPYPTPDVFINSWQV